MHERPLPLRIAGPGPGIHPDDPETWTARPFVPSEPTLHGLAAAAQMCHGCDLWRPATQAVMGEGPVPAPLMLVGEQPGDREDVVGKPFVGPAGELLDRALQAAGIDRERAFVTNVVKHFKWRPSGKRRLHDRPNSAQVRACRPWLDAELGLVRPRVLVLLGATAAQSMLGPAFRVTRERGRFVESALAPRVLATIHPSAILRAQPEARELEFDGFVSDLTRVAEELANPSQRAG